MPLIGMSCLITTVMLDQFISKYHLKVRQSRGARSIHGRSLMGSLAKLLPLERRYNET